MKFLELASKPRGDPLLQVGAMLGHIPISAEGILELKQIQEYLAAMGIDYRKDGGRPDDCPRTWLLHGPGV